MRVWKFSKKGYARKSNPWVDYVDARRQVIFWMRREYGYCDKQIAITLFISEFQISIIKEKKFK